MTVDEREAAADERDRMSDERDAAADERDAAADQRDRVADERDRTAERVEGRGWSAGVSDDVSRAGSARAGSVSDRGQSSHDRHAGAGDRVLAAHDRDAARADRQAAAREREYGLFDGLTDAFLRGPGLVELERDISRALRTEQPLVVTFIDVDNLKAINDARGHAAGDRILVKLADTLRSHLRSYDLIIRYGGDEFLCAMAGVEEVEVRERLAHVNAVLASGAEPGSVTAGVAQLRPNDAPENLIARADADLYHQRQKPASSYQEHG